MLGWWPHKAWTPMVACFVSNIMSLRLKSTFCFCIYALSLVFNLVFDYEVLKKYFRCLSSTSLDYGCYILILEFWVILLPWSLTLNYGIYLWTLWVLNCVVNHLVLSWLLFIILDLELVILKFVCLLSEAKHVVENMFLRMKKWF